MKKRILHIYKSYYPDSIGGVEELIRQLILKLDKYDQDVLFFSPKGPKLIKVDKANAYRFQPVLSLASTPLSFSALFRFGRFVKKYDILHYHIPYPFADLLHFIHRPKQKIVIYYHMEIVKQKRLLKLYQPLMRWFLKQADAILVHSEYLTKRPFLLPHQAKTSVIPIGIAEYNDFDSTKLKAIKKSYGQYAIFTGVFRYYKGLEYLIEAFKDLNYNLVLVGNGPLFDKIKAQAGAAKNIFFQGRVSDKEKFHLIKSSEMLIMPSHLKTEAFGVSQVEGLMLKKPLISCEIGTGVSFVNQHNYTGLVVKPASAIALRQAVIKLSQDDTLRQEYSKQAYLWYNKMFRLDKMCQKFDKLYQELL